MAIRGALCIVLAIILAIPSAAAADGIAAESLEAVGLSTLDGDAAAFFVLAGAEGFSWDVTAARMTLERTYSEFIAVDNPTYPANYLYGDHADAVVETREFDAVSLTSADMRVLGAILARSAGGATVSATTLSTMLIRFESDPRFDQGEPPTVETQDDVVPNIHERIEGDFLNATLAGGELELRGSLVLDLNEVDYTLASADGISEERTGTFETSRAGVIVQGREERHRLVLEDAVLRVRTPSDIFILTQQSVVTVEGDLVARAPEGTLELTGATRGASEEGVERWHGRAALALAPAMGRVTMADGDAGIASNGALVASGPVPVAWAVAALLAAFLAAGLVVLVRRRRDPEEDLHEALLAMEERRWDDALPRLARALARRPEDPLLLLDRALCLEETGRLREAAKGYEVALRRSPRSAETHFYYARTLAKLREAGASQAHLETALELDPRLVEMARREAAFDTLARA